ncbi:unnamed protein product [Zymoseptoria tritici ST99CH_1A5]|uniref:Uncharacterized protein n=1 Tax=Zymoseptoria tritici ST99CH_1A5 TaxID=1276529 RepID=A0A1Y6LI84_ZYMTR|nr:unnamed protein product [Zymoseptoria tritici ST99CH_1A5]
MSIMVAKTRKAAVYYPEDRQNKLQPTSYTTRGSSPTSRPIKVVVHNGSGEIDKDEPSTKDLTRGSVRK